MISTAEVIHAFRWLNVLFGVWLLIAPWMLAGGSMPSRWSDMAAALAIVIVSASTRKRAGPVWRLGRVCRLAHARRGALHRKRLGLRWLALAFLVAVLLNFAWEMAQAYLYQPMGTVWEATRRCVIASVGDGGMILLVLVTGRSLTDGPLQTIDRREYALIIALAVAIAVALEWWGLAAGRWAYRAQMPKLPGTQLGLVPIVQMAALAPLTLWLADLATQKREGR